MLRTKYLRGSSKKRMGARSERSEEYAFTVFRISKLEKNIGWSFWLSAIVFPIILQPFLPKPNRGEMTDASLQRKSPHWEKAQQHALRVPRSLSQMSNSKNFFKIQNLSTCSKSELQKTYHFLFEDISQQTRQEDGQCAQVMFQEEL